jgi:seryl-tRNA synthetase
LDERHGKDLCLSGTAEMGLGAKLTDSLIPKESLPQKLAAISRCFRAETSKVADEKGIYR